MPEIGSYPDESSLLWQDVSICDCNLQRLDDEQALLWEKRRAFLLEKLHVLAENLRRESGIAAPGLDMFLSSLIENRAPFSFLSMLCERREAQNSAEEAAPASFTELRREEKLWLCRFLMHEMLRNDSSEPFLARYLALMNRELHIAPSGMETPEARVCYVKGDLSERALAIICRALPSVIGVPQAGFAAACESVYYGKSDACLLPVENARDGFLHSFARLVAEYELCCTMRIELTDEEDAVHAFALYRTEYGCPAVDAPICMEFSAKIPKRFSPGAFLQTAADCGVGLMRIACAKIDADGTQSLHLHLCISESDFETFLCYLYTELPAFQLIGVYPTLLQEQAQAANGG